MGVLLFWVEVIGRRDMGAAPHKRHNMHTSRPAQLPPSDKRDDPTAPRIRPKFPSNSSLPSLDRGLNKRPLAAASRAAAWARANRLTASAGEPSHCNRRTVSLQARANRLTAAATVTENVSESASHKTLLPHFLISSVTFFHKVG